MTVMTANFVLLFVLLTLVSLWGTITPYG